MKEREIKFEIIEQLGVISEGTKGWKKELNLISWGERDAKYDLRDWDENHEKMTKGLTLNTEEIIKLRDILNRIDI